MNNPKYSIHKCSIENHLFNSENGFVLIRVYDPKRNYDQSDRDSWLCLKHAESIGKHTVKI